MLLSTAEKNEDQVLHELQNLPLLFKPFGNKEEKNIVKLFHVSNLFTHIKEFHGNSSYEFCDTNKFYV